MFWVSGIILFPTRTIENDPFVPDVGESETWVEPRRAWVAVQLAALSSYMPVAFVVGNWRSSASFAPVITATLAVCAIALVGYWALTLAGVGRWRALALLSVVVVGFWHWGDFRIHDPYSPQPLSALLAQVTLLSLIGAAAWRFADRRYFKIGVFATSVTLTVVPTLQLIALATSTPPPSIAGSSSVVEASMGDSPPDIYFIVLDGYARADVLAADYDFDNSSFIDYLEQSGFTVPPLASTNYSSTHFSIPSMLDMRFPLRDGPDVSINDLRVLAEMTAGDNAVVRTLKANGYQYVHGSSNWWGDRCGPEVDLCLDTPSIDVTTYDLLRNTPIGALLFPRSGDPGTAVSLQRISEVKRWDDVIADLASGPKFVFMHLILPHPPLFLNASCHPVPDPARSQRLINSYPPLESELLARRKAAYVEQVECANSFTETLIRSVPEDSVFIVTADHGPDSRSQLRLDAALWDDNARVERFATFTSLRLPAQCPGPSDDLVLVNVFRHVFACLMPESGLAPLGPEFYATPPACCEGPLVEIPDPDVFRSAENQPKYTSEP